MEFIKHLLEMADDAIAANGFDEILERLKEMREISKETLKEGFMDNHRGDLEKKFDELEAKIIAARRALGTINSARMTPEQQAIHKSKIMRHINFFRKQLHDVMKELGMSQREMDYHLSRIGLDREYGKPSEIFTRIPKNPADRRFRDVMNKKRNLASPDDVASFSKPKSKAGSDKLKWYQRIFK